MADHSAIEWTEATWNPIVGCSIHSPGCKSCYAMRVAWRLQHNPNPKIAAKFAGTAEMTKAGPVFTGRINLDEETLLAPLRRKKPTVYFVNSLSDLFHVNVPDEWVDRIFAVMALCPQHTFQVLTKRADRMRAYMTDRSEPGHWGSFGRTQDAAYRLMAAFPDGRWNEARAMAARQACVDALKRIDDRTNAGFKNVWLGVSVEDQKRADERREDFRATPAAVKFVSYEPAIGPVEWTGWEFVQQIIGGGESGPKARPMHPDWQRDTRDFCADHGIAYFFKQNGEFAPGEIAGDHLDPDKAAKGLSLFDGRWVEAWSYPDGHADDEPDVYRVGKKRAGRWLDGVTHDGMPG